MNNRTLRARVGAVLLVLALCLTVLPAAAASRQYADRLSGLC